MSKYKKLKENTKPGRARQRREDAPSLRLIAAVREYALQSGMNRTCTELLEALRDAFLGNVKAYMAYSGEADFHGPQMTITPGFIPGSDGKQYLVVCLEEQNLLKIQSDQIMELTIGDILAILSEFRDWEPIGGLVFIDKEGECFLDRDLALGIRDNYYGFLFQNSTSIPQ